MATATDPFENLIINHFLRNVPFTSPPTVYLAAGTAAPNEDGVTGFSEITGAGYARQELVLTAPTTGQTAISSAITFGPNTSGSNWNITSIAVFFQFTGGSYYLAKTISQKTISNGDSASWPAGDITFSVN